MQWIVEITEEQQQKWDFISYDFLLKYKVYTISNIYNIKNRDL